MTAEPRTEEASDRVPLGDDARPTLPVRNRARRLALRQHGPTAAPRAEPPPGAPGTDDPGATPPDDPAEPATDQPEAATDHPKAATDHPKAATDHPKAATDQPEAATDHSEPATDPPEVVADQPESIYRGRARVGKPRTVRATALVPGALSMPRPKPRFVPQWAKPSTSFPRRVFPRAPEPTEPPQLRTATPAENSAQAPATTPARTAAGPPETPSRSASAPVGDLPGVPPGKRNRLALPAVAAVLAAFAAGTGYLAFADSPGRLDLGRWAATAAPTTTAATTGAGATTSAARPPGDPFGAAPVVAQGKPTRLRIAAIGVDTALESLHIGPDGALTPPQGFARAGWYADGTAPGDNGPAVIAGHVDSRSGPAVFFRLRELTAGDRVAVVRGGRTVTFKVTAVRWYPKSEFPTRDVYGPTPDRQLRLITCGGVFDRSLRSYRDNLVVYAVAG